MTLCNLSIEAGARAGMIAPDQKTYGWLESRPMAPKGDEFVAACRYWQSLGSDPDAHFDKIVTIDAAEVEPMVTWGTSPEAVVPIGKAIGQIWSGDGPAKASHAQAMLDYMDLKQGSSLEGLPIDVVFIGSCTNGRIEDLRAAAAVIRGRHVAPNVRALIVPGSGRVKEQQKRKGLDRIFLGAGFEWRDAGCSMCLGMNPDQLLPGSVAPPHQTETSRVARVQVAARISCLHPWPLLLR